MYLETIAGQQIFRPSIEAELELRIYTETKMRKRFEIGTYTDGDKINEILHHYFTLYDTVLKSELPKVASRNFMENVLHQYDVSCEIRRRSNSFSKAEAERWQDIGPVFRQAIKYLAECCTMLAPIKESELSPENQMPIIERCWICAEQLVWLSGVSNQTCFLFPENSSLEILPKGGEIWFDLKIEDNEEYEQLGVEIELDTKARSRYINEAQTLYDLDRVARIIDPVAEKELGISISDILSFMTNLIEGVSMPNDDDLDIPFVTVEQLVARLKELGGLTSDGANAVINGVSLQQFEMLKEGRVIWKPKQEYRAWARPFFELPHSTGVHLIWSKQMAMECFQRLIASLAQKRLPPEWRKGQMHKAMGKYEQEITRLFEDIVIEQLRTKDVAASRFKSQIGIGDAKLAVPNEVGEIDLVAYFPELKLLVVGDDKLVKPSHEPARFRDDLDKFIEKKKNYVEQVKRKTEWVIKNLTLVERALETDNEFPVSVKIEKVASVLVTYYPTFASLFIDDFPCVSLTKLMSDIEQTSGGWPYDLVHEIESASNA